MTTTPRAPRNQLSHAEFLKIADWLRERAKTGELGNDESIVQEAKKEFDFQITPGNIVAVREALGIRFRAPSDKSAGPDLRTRVARLEKQIETMSRQINDLVVRSAAIQGSAVPLRPGAMGGMRGLAQQFEGQNRANGAAHA